MVKVPVCLLDYFGQLDMAVPEFPIDGAERRVDGATRNHIGIGILV
jgi:hypothetical protein